MSNDEVISSAGKKKPPFVFYVILAAIPIMFFIAVEVGLRLMNYGYDYQLFKEKDDGVTGFVYVNPDISYKYFGNLSSTVFNSEVGLYKDKPEQSFRIFVLGGSSTQGFPYNPQASFPAHLKRRLALLYPNKLIEVINLGASAINSYTIRDILPDVLDQSPDLILIYMGHNEYYGALGAGSSRSVNPAVANLILFLRDFRTVQMLENLISGVSKEAGSQNKNLMQKMIGESLIEYESATYRKGIIQFENNLSAILKVIRKSKVPVIIGTLTSNIRDQEPFNSKQVSKEGLSADDYYNQGKELFALGNAEEARDNFIKAKEYDGLRFRAPEDINNVIQDKAEEYAVPVADIEKIFSQNSPGSSTGANLMCDHLHPNLQGYFLMSKIFFDAILKSDILPDPKTNNTNEIDTLLLAEFPYTNLDTVVDNHILLSGLGQYPFQPPGEPNPYQDILDNDGVNFNITSINEKDSIRTLAASSHLLRGDSSAFIKEMRVFLSYFPFNEVRYMHAINLLSKQGTLDKGYPLLYESLNDLKESNGKTKALGMYYKFMRQYDSAMYYFDKAIEVTPNDDLILLDMGFIFLDKEEYSAAEDLFTKVIQNSPDNQEAFHQRSVARFELKNYEGTIADITESMKLKGNGDSISYLIRGYAHLGLNDKKSACEDWKTSAQLGSKQAQMLVQNYCNN